MRRLNDLIPATADEVRGRFRKSSEEVLGEETAEMLEGAVNRLEDIEDVAVIPALLSAKELNARAS